MFRFEEGAICFESLQVIARSVKELPEEAVEAAQAELLQAAESPKCEPQQLRRLGDQIKLRDDASGWARSALRQHEKRPSPLRPQGRHGRDRGRLARP